MTQAPESQHTFVSKKTFSHDSPWFSGHFPNNPILPGIAQLSVVLDTIQQATTKKLQLKAFKRVKFKQLINPNDKLEIKAVQNQKEPETYSFEIQVKGEIACQGIMLLRNKSNTSIEGEKE